MPPKRVVRDLFSDAAEKLQRLLDPPTSTVYLLGVALTRPSQIREMELALDGGDGCYPRMLYLTREIAENPSLPPSFAMRLLRFCVQERLEYLARRLLANQILDLATPEGNELLSRAVSEGQAELAAQLVRHGVDLSVRYGEDSHTILHAVMRSREIGSDGKEELARLLLDRGVDVDARDGKGRSVLRDAIRLEHCSCRLVEELLKRGARVRDDEADDANDIFWASSSKAKLLPKLIQHQVPDEETRNKRGAMAVEYLIAKLHTEDETIDALRIVKRILNLGVPVDFADPFAERRVGKLPCPLLSTALLQQEKAVIKLLLESGADPHRKNNFGHTPLFQATAFTTYTHASRWLIERGASVHARNDDGCYPIHGACETKSLKNIHLLLSLGADLNVADYSGCTPFCYTDDTYYFNAALALCIQHFALTVAKGGRVDDKDMEKINKYGWSRNLFEKCAKQLKLMKVEMIHGDMSYFSLLSGSIRDTMELMKNPNFARSFRRNPKKRVCLFPQYSYTLWHSFEIAEKRYEMLLAEMKQVQSAFGKSMPDRAVEKITYCLCFKKLERCQRDYYMSLHATLKNTKADKKKIL